MLEVLIILVLILANGLFAMSEIAVVSARKARLQQLSSEGNKAAAAALELSENPNRFLSTVQIGITLVGIFAGAYGGATLSEPLAERLNDVPLLAPYAQGLSLFIVVVTITYFSLVLGELVPKRIALNRPEAIASLMAPAMQVLSRLTAPVVHLLSLSTETALRLLRVKVSEEAAISEEEIAVLIEQGTQAGVFHEAEQDLVENVFWLADRRVSTLMTPRHKVVWLDVNDSPEQVTERVAQHRHSRFVVADGSLDQVIGFVNTRDLLLSHFGEQAFDLRAMVQRPLFLPETSPALRVLERFKETGVHLALVVDEYGSLEGLVTPNDLLEALVGDLPELDRPEEPKALRREDGSWLLDGLLGSEDLKELLELDTLPHEEVSDYRTLGGLVVTHLGHIPRSGEHFDWSGWRFEVVDMDGSRVDKVLVTQVGGGGLEAS